MAAPEDKSALDTLNLFISKYAPALSKEDGQLFYSTDEISNAVADHTGTRLQSREIYEMMINMGYKYDLFEGGQVNWLLKENA